MTAPHILSVLLLLAPATPPMVLLPVAEAIGRASSGPTDTAVLIALAMRNGFSPANVFGLSPHDITLVSVGWERSGRIGQWTDAQAAYTARLARGAFSVCPRRAMTSLPEQVAYIHGRVTCRPDAGDRAVATLADRALRLLVP